MDNSLSTNSYNLLLIMADQFRYDWMSCSGFPISTPNIDRIASRGIRFTQASCTSPLCTPSRSSLATGKYPHNCGVVVHDAVLPRDQQTYYQLLRKNGYRVGVVGKSDLHKDIHYYGKNGDLPLMYHFGFTDLCETEGKGNAGHPGMPDTKPGRAIAPPLHDLKDKKVVPLGPYQHMLDQKGELEIFARDYDDRLYRNPSRMAAQSILPEEDFHDYFIGEQACKMLRDFPTDFPWHLFVSFAGPHDPWDPPKSYSDRFANADFPESIADNMEGKPEWIKRRAKVQCGAMTDGELLKIKRHYAGSISLIDDWVGHILDELERRGETDNTIIVFAADHGEMMGDHQLLLKKCMYEGSVRVPLIISAPWMESPSTSNVLAELFDLAPTFLDLAKADYDHRDMDAKSLVSVLKGETDQHKEYQYSELLNTQMLYDGHYKWIRNTNDLDELYDLKNDPQELHNCFSEHPEVIQRMRKHTFNQ